MFTATLIAAAASTAATTVTHSHDPLPFWSAPEPDCNRSLCGYDLLPADFSSDVFYGSTEDGFYNHAAMLHYHDNMFTISWKNGLVKEDKPGQRVLYSQSINGRDWSPYQILFPNMSTNATPVAQFAGPYAVINDRLYATATPAVIADGDAQGAQWCLWPDGLDPRNCAAPERPGTQPSGILMMRRVYPGVGSPLGDVFWVSPNAPAKELEQASQLNGIKGIHDMDAQTQADIATLTPYMDELPCDEDSGTLKCEGCAGGCQLYKALPKVGLANERTHWPLPEATQEQLLQRYGVHYTEVIAYRSHSNALYASLRIANSSTEYTPGVTDWTPLNLTTVPNDDSNINAGRLPGNRTYLLANGAPNKVRDPLTIAISNDGLNFSACAAIQTCHHMPENR